MVVWETRQIMPVMESAGKGEPSPPSSGDSAPARNDAKYTVPPASLVACPDPIKAVRRANTPDRIQATKGAKTARKWTIKQAHNLQLPLKSKTVQDSFPTTPVRVRFVKKRSTTTNNNTDRGFRVSGHTPNEPRSSKPSSSVTSRSHSPLQNESKAMSASVSQIFTKVSIVQAKGNEDKSPWPQHERKSTWGETSPINRQSPLNPDTKLTLGDVKIRQNKSRRSSVQFPLNGSSSYDNHPNLGRLSRPKTVASFYRTRTRDTLQRDLDKTPKPQSIPNSTCQSPQPSFASEYIAQIFQTSDKFLISRPGSGKQQRPATGCRQQSRPKSAEPSQQSSSRPTHQTPLKARIQSSVPFTNPARDYCNCCATIRANSTPIQNLRLEDQDSTVRPATPLRLLKVLVGNTPSQESESENMSSVAADDQGDERLRLVPDISADSSTMIELQHQHQASCLPDNKTSFDRKSDSCGSSEHQQSTRRFDEGYLMAQALQEDPTKTIPLRENVNQNGRLNTYGETTSIDADFTEEETETETDFFDTSDSFSNFDDQRPDSHDTVTGNSLISGTSHGSLDRCQCRVSAMLGSSPVRPKTATTRRDLEEHFQREKQAVLSDLRSDLGRRLRLRKQNGIMSDLVFQKQLRSGFWTSDVLYHRWGKEFMEMRTHWRSCTGRLGDQSDCEEDGVLIDTEAVRILQHSRGIEAPSCVHVTSQVKGHTNINLTTRSMGSASLRLINRGNQSVKERPQALLNLADVNNGLCRKPQTMEDPVSRGQRMRALFVSAVTKVTLITRVALCMIRASMELNPTDFMTQLHFYITKTMEENLAFQEEKISRKYSKLQVPNWARKIGLKPPWKRSPDDVMTLYSLLMNLTSFQKFTHPMRVEVCRAASYCCCEKGRVVLRQGHVAHNFYFIYSGSVFVQVDKDKYKGDVITTSQTNVIEKGSYFGGIGVLGGRTSRRQASVICRETTELFGVEKRTFLKLCSDLFARELQEKITAARSVEILRRFPQENLEQLCLESVIEEVAYGRVIERDTARTDNVYFILRGKVAILKEFDSTNAFQDRPVTAEASRNQTTPTPSDRGQQTPSLSTDKNKLLMSVGELGQGDCTEISLSPSHGGKNVTSPGAILISNGVRIMTMSKMKLEEFAPKDVFESLRRHPVQPLRIPTNEAIYRKYTSDLHWEKFKYKVVSSTLHQEKTNALIGSKPSTANGSTRWGRCARSEVNCSRRCTVRTKSAPPRLKLR